MSVFHSVPGVPCKNGTLFRTHKLVLRFNAVGEDLWVKRSFAYVELTLT